MVLSNHQEHSESAQWCPVHNTSEDQFLYDDWPHKCFYYESHDLGFWIFFRGSPESRLIVVEGIHVPASKYPFLWRFLAFKLFVVLFWKLVK